MEADDCTAACSIELEASAWEGKGCKSVMREGLGASVHLLGNALYRRRVYGKLPKQMQVIRPMHGTIGTLRCR